MKKLWIICFTLLLALALTACGESASQSSSESGQDSQTSGGSGITEISILFSKPEIAKPFEETAKRFGEEHNVKVTVIPLAGQTIFEKMSSLYASGNPPTIMMGVAQEFDTFQHHFLDLSDQPWVEHVLPGMTDFVTIDGKIYGMPVTVEGWGFIYNNAVVEEAVGGPFDPSTIKTHQDLENLFKQIAALEGVEALHVSPMDWSLGAHFTNPFFAAQSENRDERHQFMQDLKDGKVSLTDNKVFNGWLKTFDLMKEYNSEKHSPLGANYDEGPLALAGGKVGLWFMGNWAYPQLQELDPDGEYGFIPVPLSDNPEDYGNSHISVAVAGYWVVDASRSTPEQQEAALQFLNWLVLDETGQDYAVNKLNLIPVFDNFQIKPVDSLSLSIMEYMESGNTLEGMNLYYPADAWPTMGASLQKYLADHIDRDTLIEELEMYWHSVK
ncbi:ABC transporter substrate-binding protein [Caldalkalibacillus thermarum]|uniref:ABC transporter substrate-binding protein n=1 Tax=Caldalkalibacillus thermarum TaxID=296745 RepID=UPI00166BD7F2|nr:ABC transporter substrate-binding protein [Caldalkalibacillus thermarum]GGK34327.1 ABC transporter substrate-binding protein [Caldalkalibacillus thermarum]